MRAQDAVFAGKERSVEEMFAPNPPSSRSPRAGSVTPQREKPRHGRALSFGNSAIVRLPASPWGALGSLRAHAALCPRRQYFISFARAHTTTSRPLTCGVQLVFLKKPDAEASRSSMAGPMSKRRCVVFSGLQVSGNSRWAKRIGRPPQASRSLPCRPRRSNAATTSLKRLCGIVRSLNSKCARKVANARRKMERALRSTNQSGKMARDDSPRFAGAPLGEALWRPSDAPQSGLMFADDVFSLL